MKYFNLRCVDRYINPIKNFTSYFLFFEEEETRIELMHKPGMGTPVSRGNLMGLAHFSIAVGSPEMVDTLTERLRKDGYTILSEPRTTGDGEYERVVADPEGNYWQITA